MKWDGGECVFNCVHVCFSTSCSPAPLPLLTVLWPPQSPFSWPNSSQVFFHTTFHLCPIEQDHKNTFFFLSRGWREERANMWVDDVVGVGVPAFLWQQSVLSVLPNVGTWPPSLSDGASAMKELMISWLILIATCGCGYHISTITSLRLGTHRPPVLA